MMDHFSSKKYLEQFKQNHQPLWKSQPYDSMREMVIQRIKGSGRWLGDMDLNELSNDQLLDMFKGDL